MSLAERLGLRKKKGKNIVDEIEARERVYVLFYAIWCPFSQRFLPIFEEYARSNPQECLKVIATDEPEACKKYNIEYYPTVILFEKGEIKKRLDAEPGIGLDEGQLRDITGNR
jgi:thiol-disulfide isomerase/thioredoxin